MTEYIAYSKANQRVKASIIRSGVTYVSVVTASLKKRASITISKYQGRESKAPVVYGASVS